jgi:hypothetical protein
LSKVGDFLMFVNSANRWIYESLDDHAPCQTIKWNVVKQIFPVKQKHLDAFLKLKKKYNQTQSNIGYWPIKP